jgi:hypothetical protein
MVEMGGSSDGHGVHPKWQQGVDIADCLNAQRPSHEVGLSFVGIGHCDELRVWQLRQHAGVVASHHSDANDANAEGPLATVVCGFPHRRRLPLHLGRKSSSTWDVGLRPFPNDSPNTFYVKALQRKLNAAS